MIGILTNDKQRLQLALQVLGTFPKAFFQGRFPKYQFPKWEITHFGSCHLGKYPWEVAAWENAFEKVPKIALYVQIQKHIPIHQDTKQFVSYLKCNICVG